MSIGLAAVIWLCRPGIANDPCAATFTTTVVTSEKALRVTHQPQATATRFDCFYVYPTVSREATDNADLQVQPAERDVAIAQGSPFSGVCDVWAPMYRQLTLTALLNNHYYERRYQNISYASMMQGWREYLAHYNRGRPIVFIGHSQGAQLLIRLLHNEVESNPALRKQLVMAVLLGANVVVSHDRRVPGSFAHLPLCTSTHEAGCVIAYSTFANPPPKNSIFGIPGQGVSLPDETAREGVSVACTNPDALDGGSASLTASFTVGHTGYWWAPANPAPSTVATPWVSYPGLFTAKCVHRGDSSWLRVTRNGSPSAWPHLFLDTPEWGLHRYDMSLALDALIRDVASAEGAWRMVACRRRGFFCTSPVGMRSSVSRRQLRRQRCPRAAAARLSRRRLPHQKQRTMSLSSVQVAQGLQRHAPRTVTVRTSSYSKRKTTSADAPTPIRRRFLRSGSI